MVRTGATFADAAAEWLRYSEQERACKHTTMTDYRIMVATLSRTFGDEPIGRITSEHIELWKGRFMAGGRSNRTLQKYLVVLHGVFKRAMKVYGLPRNPMAIVERPRLPRRAGIDVFSRAEVMALVEPAENEQDGVLYLTAAFTGLRLGELLGLRWEDIDPATPSGRAIGRGNGLSTTRGRGDRTPSEGDDASV
jgi:integrase